MFAAAFGVASRQASVKVRPFFPAPADNGRPPKRRQQVGEILPLGGTRQAENILHQKRLRAQLPNRPNHFGKQVARVAPPPALSGVAERRAWRPRRQQPDSPSRQFPPPVNLANVRGRRGATQHPRLPVKAEGRKRVAAQLKRPRAGGLAEARLVQPKRESAHSGAEFNVNRPPQIRQLRSRQFLLPFPRPERAECENKITSVDYPPFPRPTPKFSLRPVNSRPPTICKSVPVPV